MLFILITGLDSFLKKLLSSLVAIACQKPPNLFLLDNYITKEHVE